MPRIQTISREEVLKLAANLAAEYGESLTLTAFRRQTGFSQWAIFDLFGNWKNLREQVGLTPEAPRARNKVSKSQILDVMRQQAAIHGEALTERKFLKATGLSGRLIADRFGSWGELRQLVGLKPRAKVKQQYTPEEIMADLFRVYKAGRRRPVFHKHKLYGGRISPCTIQQHFGSWATACEMLRRHLIDLQETGQLETLLRSPNRPD